MNQTEQYQLTQWDQSDRIMMEDFNADNAKIETALAEHADTLAQHTAVLSGCGNCLAYQSSYTGTGSGMTTSHTFPAKPLVIMIGHPSSTAYSGLFWQGRNVGSSFGSYGFTLVWDGNTVTWTGGGNTETGLNQKGVEYSIFALLDAAAE